MKPNKFMPLYRLLFVFALIIANSASVFSAFAAGNDEADKLFPPEFSHSGGWYREGFELTLTAKDDGAVIYYTLDGSVPDESSLVYTSPIKIRDRRNDPNTISEIQTSVYKVTPRDTVYKGTVVRAVAVKDGMVSSEVITNTYFIDKSLSKKYTMPVISLAVEPDDFFDYERGIYVPGKIYDERLDPNKADWEREGNYTQRGAEWERPAHIEFFETDGTLAFSQNVGVRLHGGATRSNAQKALRIYAKSEYDSQKSIKYEIYPGLTRADGTPLDEFKRILLRNSGNDWQYTMIRDSFMQSLVSHLSIDTQASRPAIVFINGEYWGIQNIQERLDRFYIENKYGIDENRIVILEGDGWLSEGLPGDEAHYRNMIDYMRNNDMSLNENYEYIQTQMDVDNFIDYQISEIYFANDDWPGNNIQFWRARTDGYEEGAGYADGRWRWMLFDTDFGFGLYEGRNGHTHPTLPFAMEAGGYAWPNPDWSTFILRTLMKNDEFRHKFANRFADVINTAFVPSRVESVLDSFIELYEPEMGEHISRWQNPDSLPRWRNNIEDLRHFGQNRPKPMLNQLMIILKLDGMYTLKVNCDDNMGSVQVNSIIINEDTLGVDGEPYPWSGTYFKAVPVTLSAMPKAGYRFAGWQGIDESMLQADENGTAGLNADTIKVLFNDAAEVTAVFEPVSGKGNADGGAAADNGDDHGAATNVPDNGKAGNGPIYIVMVLVLLAAAAIVLLAIYNRLARGRE